MTLSSISSATRSSRLSSSEAIAGDGPLEPGPLGHLLAAEQPQPHARDVQRDRRVVSRRPAGDPAAVGKLLKQAPDPLDVDVTEPARCPRPR